MLLLGGHFSKWPPLKTTFAYILVSETSRDMILVSIPMFSGSTNSLKVILDHLVVSAILKFKMAAV
jgi:hypothetical protein